MVETDLEEVRRRIKLKTKLSARTENQKDFVHAVKENQIIVLTGCPGSGKTYCSVGLACYYLQAGKVDNLLFTRPLVECGDLGTLPGSVKERTDPYYAPIFKKLDKFLGKDQVKFLMEEGIINFKPLELLRGESIEDTFVVLDEVSNCTVKQIKMFVTRFDYGSKFIMQGDMSQCDLDFNGLKYVHNILSGQDIDNFEWCYFDESDVQRPKIVGDLSRAIDLEGK